jgi:hypothetical protein
MVKPAAFRIDGDVIHITNRRSRGHSVVLIVCAAAILALPFVRGYLPAGLIEWDEEGPPWMLFLVGGFACLSAAFWWSVVTVDPKAGQVVILHRWGLWLTRRRRALSSFDTVALRTNGDGDASVYLEGGARDWWVETNDDRAVVWGRPYEETREIAAVLARRLQLRFNDYASLRRPC